MNHFADNWETMSLSEVFELVQSKCLSRFRVRLNWGIPASVDLIDEENNQTFNFPVDADLRKSVLEAMDKMCEIASATF